MNIRYGYLASAFALALLALSSADPARANGSSGGGEPAVDTCSNDDGAFDNAAFVIATSPQPGARVSSGFTVVGCSRTFESTVNWRLLAPNGNELASGFAQGGGVDGPGDLVFEVNFSVSEHAIGHLEVFEEDVSDGEGNPPGRTVLPLVLQP